jgi:hypothetical protein
MGSSSASLNLSESFLDNSGINFGSFSNYIITTLLVVVQREGLVLLHHETVWSSIPKVSAATMPTNTSTIYYVTTFQRWVCHQKERELEREIWRNTDTTSQGTHADPNRI